MADQQKTQDKPGTAVAKFEKPRIPWYPEIGKKYGITKGNWTTLIDATFPSAKTLNGVCMALDYCAALKLDVFLRVVHVVPVYSSEKSKEAGHPVYVETIWPGIALLRTIAFRTKQYAGCDPTAFGPDTKGEFEDEVEVWSGPKGQRVKTVKPVKVKITYPAWAQVTVYRRDGTHREPYPGPRVYWLAGYGRMGKTDIPNDRWQRDPSGMLEKQAEAAALRKAFPESGDLTTDIEERFGGQTIEGTATEVDIPEQPKSAWFTNDDDDSGEQATQSPQDEQKAAAATTPAATTEKAAPAQPAEEDEAAEQHASPAKRFVAEIIAKFEAARDLNVLNHVYKANEGHMGGLDADDKATVEESFDAALKAFGGK